jgi:hypothetical protein
LFEKFIIFEKRERITRIVLAFVEFCRIRSFTEQQQKNNCETGACRWLTTLFISAKKALLNFLYPFGLEKIFIDLNYIFNLYL